MNINELNSVEKIREFFANDRFATENGMEIVSAKAGEAVCRVVISEKHKNAMGAVMGGVVFTLADFAFAIASNLQTPNTVSLTADISYLGVARGKVLLAEARCIKRGRNTCVYTVDVSDELSNAVALVTITGFTKS